MTPIVTDKETGRELWQVKECAEHGGVESSTWTTYSAQRRTPFWDAVEVKSRQTSRPDSPAKDHK
ncbi:hypothetical protein PAB09_00930 [Corynebacterium sp. SCR221107]|uniref:hypothetical protein n=1 Tax=Corynebacterium sp. SCR221107 TaxID=3017361 RepID=UPI0022EC411A|nr:hypothetical protein [Corynebacterium sp. SCR221107]WBT08950.1 hypothetical protein PAB09_00930 [Corynebacterium sp. SCR221107]